MEEADLIGETGLDYYRNLSSKENQIKNFTCNRFGEIFLSRKRRNVSDPSVKRRWFLHG